MSENLEDETFQRLMKSNKIIILVQGSIPRLVVSYK